MNGPDGQKCLHCDQPMKYDAGLESWVEATNPIIPDRTAFDIAREMSTLSLSEPGLTGHQRAIDLWKAFNLGLEYAEAMSEK
jgi:hypothetical protein